MFSGIIESMGHLAAREERGGDQRLRIDSDGIDWAMVAIGDSIAVNGVCLTAIEVSTRGFCADVSSETLACSILGEVQAGQRVNLERALLPTTRLDGHLVSGHVDGIGQICDLRQDARSWRIVIEAPQSLSRYIAAKGSICIDGVSLTVNGIEGARFDVNIVPHTWQVTTLGDFRPGRRVNLEVDLIARYLERLLQARGESLEHLLREHGFTR